ncbi:MAG TPA: hypothetical protein VLA96_07760 [Terriglobales bacterium]|jgi:hypothetical protein|nr:hypothetical protein [Terriglobales bacterium]
MSARVFALLFCLSAATYAQQAPRLLREAGHCLATQEANWLRLNEKSPKTVSAGVFLDRKSYPGEEYLYVVVYDHGTRDRGFVFGVSVGREGRLHTLTVNNNARFVAAGEKVEFAPNEDPLWGIWTQQHMLAAIRRIRKEPAFMLRLSNLHREMPSVQCDSYVSAVPRIPNRPKPLVQSLYAEVVAHHPLGISVGGKLKVFAPYLSKALLHRINLANTCLEDWDRQNPDPTAKPPGIEGGLFTGDDLRGEPQAFVIERVQSAEDGSVRVYVRLTHQEPGESPWSWRVAAIVVRESGRPVVDDVIYLGDTPQDVDTRLSEYLTQGCDGPRWVGSGVGSDNKQQE